MGHEVAQLAEALRYKPVGRGFDSRWYHWNFSLTLFFRPHYGPGVDSASNRNEYQEYFLGVKAAGAWGWQLYHLNVPIVLKSGSLNLLEHSGPVQACNGIALPLLYITLADSRLCSYRAYLLIKVFYYYYTNVCTNKWTGPVQAATGIALLCFLTLKNLPNLLRDPLLVHNKPHVK